MAIKVFSRYYVATPHDSNLGYAVPLEGNAACEKRRHSADSWATRGRSNPQTRKYETVPGKSMEFDNLPAEGFKITDDIKRTYWGGGNVVFRIWDPRGYECEIQSQNLMMLISHCNIEKGLIVGKCIWGREGGKNILLHETSEEYQNAVKAAETVKPAKNIKERDLVVGNLYERSNGEIVRYLGMDEVFYRFYYLNTNTRVYTAWHEEHSAGKMHLWEGEWGNTASKSSIVVKQSNGSFQKNDREFAQRFSLTKEPAQPNYGVKDWHGRNVNMYIQVRTASTKYPRF